ncbi:MAG: hypothetical protein AAGG00_20440, partial [Cyanobacteria bacterium P01_H01_bin.150]
IPGIDMTRVERESMNLTLAQTRTAIALRKAASPQPGKTATDIVIRGLLHELGEIPGVEPSAETRLQKLEEELQQLRSSIKERAETPTDSRTEEKIEALNNRVAKLEGALGAIQHCWISVHLTITEDIKIRAIPTIKAVSQPLAEALDEQKLALRLNVNIPTLQEKHQTLDKKDFEEWSKNRDRGKYMWRFNEKDGLYHSVK